MAPVGLGSNRLDSSRVRDVFERLLAGYGPQRWWPGETPFEVMIGAVLTQNTSWANVERAIGRLKEARLTDPGAICAAPGESLARLIQSAGYFNLKARRLKSLCAAIVEAGGEERLRGLDTETLRAWLLGVNGVGPETADDILLYAFERPVFVVDAYTRRVFGRLGLLAGSEGYETIRAAFEAALEPSPALYNEYHALIVRHAKEVCRKRPTCAGCLLRTSCAFPSGG